jgi:hypothetical protein
MFQRNPSNLSYFLNDCIISGAADLTIASVFVIRFVQNGRGLIIAAVFISFLAINIMFFICAKVAQNQMRCEKTAENRLKDLMMEPDGGALDVCEMMPCTNRATESRNYCYEIVFQESINSIYESSV